MSLETKKLTTTKDDTANSNAVAVKTEPKEAVKNSGGNEHKIRNANSSEAKSNHDKKDNRGLRKNFDRKPKAPSEWNTKVIQIRKINKVTTGGRNLRFSAVVAIGNGKGVVGLGIAKAKEVVDAIKKATDDANKNLVTVNITNNNNSIAHEVNAKFCASRILLKPAKEGIGIKAGGSARDILELVGIHNIYSKSLCSRNKVNLARATIEGLKCVKPAEYFNKNITVKRNNG